MTANEFIFSNEWKPRLARHLSFWLIYYLQTVLVTARMTGFADFFRYQSYAYPVVFAAAILPVCFFSVYISLYILFPLLKQKKYILFSTGLIVSAVLNCIIELFIYLLTRPYTCSDCGTINLQEKINIMGAFGINVASFLGVVALGIKFTKSWYQQQLNNRMLARQKITNELKLLKARIQPDFLFETLQALFNTIITDKKQAAEILLKFSELLSYTLYECDDDFVSVERVLQITEEFVALEKMMMKTNITSASAITGNISNKYIPSFIVLPLIQNCITALHNHPDKTHFAKIELNTDNDIFFCTIHIKTGAFTELKKIYPGMINTFAKRLEAFYNNKYTLDFKSEKEAFTVALSLLLSNDFIAGRIDKATEKVYANTTV